MMKKILLSLAVLSFMVSFAQDVSTSKGQEVCT